MVFKNPVSVLVLIHSPEHEILLLERASHAGFWQSVTGSLEPSELPLETAQRELQEETGIHVPASALVDWHLSNCYEIFVEWRHRYAPDVTHNLEHVFSVCVPRTTAICLSAREHRQYAWCSAAQAAKQVFSWSNRDAILMLASQKMSRI